MTDGIISSVVDQLFIIIKDQVRELRTVSGVEKEVKNLSSKLKKIREVLDDAERRSFKEKGVKLWVEEIQDFCYQVEDVLDEWNTRNRRQQMESSSCFHFKRFVMHRDIAKKIKELDSRLDQIMKDKDVYNFVTVTHTHACDQESKRVSTTTSFVDESEIQGRDIDASNVIRELMENAREKEEKGPLVISIVGVGGIGKTTLAQLVYGDQQIKARFDERVWVCVSDPFDQIKIAKAIVESTTQSSTDLSQLQVLLEKIQSTLSQKRFLLVLDDVWTEQYSKWEPLKNSLKVGLPGSRILVTSRSERVARMMGSVYLHRVNLISDFDAWLLLSRIAFSARREEACSEKLKEIGQKIAQRCRGLPLAVKVMGSLLRLKDTEEEWQNVLSKLDIKFWNLEEVETDIFPHLYLSYDDLTPEMKRCFSYCAVFPKDYEIEVDKVIRIWMAQGYLTTTNGNNDRMEQKGREVFGNLAMRSLFQDLEKDDRDSNIISCKMHDIVYDFAEFCTRNECYSIGSRHEDKVKIEKLRHLSWQKTGRPMDSASICDVTGKLRSFFAEHLSPEQLTHGLFNHLKSVRVLGLRGCKLQKLPKEVGNLHHLRYIDLSYSKVEELPNAIFFLDNLQTLDLEGCECLSKLSEGIGNLRHLRYIDLSKSNIDELPNTICSLDNLQTLNLGGCKRISRLPQGIGTLCHLRYIDLSKCNINELPDTICTLDDLQTLNLRGCKRFSRLPQGIGNLRHLRFIDLNWSKVEELPNTIVFLDNLEILNLGGCQRLSTLPEEIGNLRHLRYIDVSWSKIEELPSSICSLDNLQILNLTGCQRLFKLPEGIENLGHLRYINLSRSNVEELCDAIYSLNNLQILH